ncbi:hypothetical protein FGADI_9900 [Fusarium gaditjirri]|uniref:Uncharacterized protein n=1 Tax=Fusarium gaditjirri TaxID=282569 RepID=A0A8H4SYX1_9HYPO|nr:hypothetical protein FGADI_9900 [Fusarium gaditjirri]
MSQSSDEHPNQESASSSANPMSSSPPVASSSLATLCPPVPANSEPASDHPSALATETTSTYSQYRGHEESHNGRLPASLPQESISNYASRPNLTLGDLARQTKLLAAYHDMLSGQVARFGERIHDLHNAIILVMEDCGQTPEVNRSVATDHAHQPDEAASAQHSTPSQTTPDHR